MKLATGTFEVKLAPQPHSENVGDPAIGRMSIDKKFSGDLEATSLGQMLAFRSEVKGSVGYVAMEKVKGSLHGLNGTFVLQHNGSMNRGAPQLEVSVVADSGTDQLKGLTGKMKIIIEGSKHSYEFEYQLETS